MNLDDPRFTIKLDRAKTKNQLELLMDRNQYLGKFNRKHVVDMAWEYIKHKSKVVETSYTTYKEKVSYKTGKKKIIRRTSEFGIEMKGKKYHKGRFLPHDVRIENRPFKYIQKKNGQIVKQAQIGVKIDGKWYRKGQFLPKKKSII